jgi:hypothetical protein
VKAVLHLVLIFPYGGPNPGSPTDTLCSVDSTARTVHGSAVWGTSGLLVTHAKDFP